MFQKLKGKSRIILSRDLAKTGETFTSGSALPRDFTFLIKLGCAWEHSIAIKAIARLRIFFIGLDFTQVYHKFYNVGKNFLCLNQNLLKADYLYNDILTPTYPRIP